MNIGIRLGAPLEPAVWTEDSIYKTYGDIKGYVKDYKNFAADDDVNGPVYFLRALYDNEGKEITAKDIGRAWLNYARENLGMFWWGGYGVSTEHTAYLNLKHGIDAPESGSMKRNGKAIAEQIGGQIFIDTWGLVNPCNPKEAARYGEMAASVSHDGEGIYGARFMCACISKAFEADTIDEVIEAGLNQIPKDSEYYKVCESVIDFYNKNPDDFRACFRMLENNWGYDKYKGVCHIIPNAGVCILALLYGKGDFTRTVEIAVMCGWDTDCNAGNVGTILGVFCGLESIPAHYRIPINDCVVLSGISGYINILDIPSYAKEIAALGYKLQGLEIPDNLKQNFGEIHFDFSLDGSTHGLRTSHPHLCRISHSKEKSIDGNKGTLKALIDGIGLGENSRVFYKPFYGREDFDDERYSPVFSPKAYPGQTVKLKLLMERYAGSHLELIPYLRTFSNKNILRLGHKQYEENNWFNLEFTLPDTEGDMIDEIGIIVEGVEFTDEKTYGAIYIDEFSITGKSKYTIDMSKQKAEFNTVTPFSVDRGYWEIEEKFLHALAYDKAFAYGGNFYENNYIVTANIRPECGKSHVLIARAKGAMMGYAAGFAEDKVCIYKNNYGYEVIKEAHYPWIQGKEYKLSFRVEDDNLSLYVNEELILETEDSDYEHGMYGCGLIRSGRTYFSDFVIDVL